MSKFVFDENTFQKQPRPIYQVVKEKQHDRRWLRTQRKELAKLARKLIDARKLNDASKLTDTRKLTDPLRDTELEAAERMAERVVKKLDNVFESMQAHVAEQQDLRFLEWVEQQNALDVQVGEPTSGNSVATTDTNEDTTDTDDNTTDTD
jgi:hypothetical protein